MTILSTKKGNTPKNEIDPVEIGTPHNHQLSLPHGQIQSENLNLGSERLFVGERSSERSVWNQNVSVTHSIVGTAREDKRNSHEYETDRNLGKRRLRTSPMRSLRTKHIRVDATSGGNVSTATVVGIPPAEVTSAIGNLPTQTPECNGCNSEDEYESRSQAQISEEEWVEKERRFEKKMRKKGLIITLMKEDGACLFRAVADQVYGDQDMHSIVRKHCMDYVSMNKDYFSQYVTEDFSQYVSRKRNDNVHGNHIEIQALSEMYSRTIEVFCYKTDPINIFHGTNQNDNAPIRLSYHRGIHYNSLVDPFKATIGVGLGLPGHHPGLAEKNVLKEAARQSEDVHIEQAMLEDKLRATDWEATNEAIEEQVSRESYLQWLKDNERRNRVARSPTAPSSSSTVTSSSGGEIRSPRRSQGNNISPLGSPYRDSSFRNSPSRLSPPPSVPSTSTSSPNTQTPGLIATPPSPDHAFKLIDTTSSFINHIPPQMFGLNEWDDAGILAQVLAASQQEYLDTLKSSMEPEEEPS